MVERQAAHLIVRDPVDRVHRRSGAIGILLAQSFVSQQMAGEGERRHDPALVSRKREHCKWGYRRGRIWRPDIAALEHRANMWVRDRRPQWTTLGVVVCSPSSTAARGLGLR